MEGYRKRVLDGELDELMPALPAIAIEGAKGVGKTATATQRASSRLLLVEARQREVVMADPGHVLRVEPPVLIDEWQLVPEVWDQVRRAVDDGAEPGRFLLTGSAGLAPGVRVHSGAGRIVRLMLRPLAVCERGLVEPSVALGALLAGSGGTVEGASPLGLVEYAEEILRSGFPGIRDLPERARRVQLASYVARVVDRDLEESGGAVRRPEALTAWLTAYAAATGTTASYNQILDAATAGETDKPARQTVAGYREHLVRLFVLDPLPAWAPSLSPLKRLVASPKHHLVDPALAAVLVGVGRDALLKGEGDRLEVSDGTLLGALFESLATLTVRVLAQAAEARVYHLRTRGGEREIDLIVEGADRRVVACEVKLSASVTDADVRHLLWLKETLGDRVADLVVLTTGPHAYRRRDGVAVVPLALLT